MLGDESGYFDVLIASQLSKAPLSIPMMRTSCGALLARPIDKNKTALNSVPMRSDFGSIVFMIRFFNY